MKTFKSLLAILPLFFLTLTAHSAIVIPGVPVVEFTSEFKGQMVKATLLNGEWIAVVDLPEVEIVGLKSNSTVHKAIIHKGTLIADVQLPAVEIKAERIHSAAELASAEKLYERIYDLPVIEIETAFPVDKLSKAENADNTIQAVIELDEVVITYTKTDDLQAIKPNSFSISTEKGNKYLVASTVSSEILYALNRDLQGEEEYKYYTVSVDNCKITSKNQKICEMIIKMSNTAMEGLKENLIRTITE